MNSIKYYEFMHKDIIVGFIVYNYITGNIKFKINDTKYLPVGGSLNNMKLYDWWHDRSVPVSRRGLNKYINNPTYLKVQNLMFDNLALSLTDCYWVRPINSGYTWDSVNMFKNDFCDRLGILSYTAYFSMHNVILSFMPSMTTQGEIKKKWIIGSNNNRVLLKGNHVTSYRQSLNEVFVSEIHQSQGFKNFVTYKLVEVTEISGIKGIGCACKAFTSEDIEFISGWEICQLFKQKQNMNWYLPYVETCIKLGVNRDDLIYNLDYMIMSDYVMSNTDRHFNNFGLLRDANSLSFIGVAPIFDTGNSMFWKDSYIPVDKGLLELKSSSFLSKETRGLKNVKDRKVLDLSKLPDKSLFMQYYLKESNQETAERLYKAYSRKIEYLDDFQHGKDIWKYKS